MMAGNSIQCDQCADQILVATLQRELLIAVAQWAFFKAFGSSLSVDAEDGIGTVWVEFLSALHEGKPVCGFHSLKAALRMRAKYRLLTHLRNQQREKLYAGTADLNAYHDEGLDARPPHNPEDMVAVAEALSAALEALPETEFPEIAPIRAHLLRFGGITVRALMQILDLPLNQAYRRHQLLMKRLLETFAVVCR